MANIPVCCQPDSVAFLPNSKDIIVATYTHSEGVRSGSLMVLHSQSYAVQQCNYQTRSQLKLNCGILHAKPYIINGSNYAICAASDGSIKFAMLDPVISIEGSTVVDSKALVLSVCKDSYSGKVVGGLSTGKIALIDRGRVVNWWTGHELEVWACYMDGKLIYTGADDSRLRIWDINTLSNSTSNPNNYIAEIKSFGAGVTWISTSDTEIIAGSHDNCLRWFDKRALNCEVKRLKLPGSPWKLVLRDSIFYAAVCQGLVYAFTQDNSLVGTVAQINEKIHYEFENLPQTEHSPLIYSVDVKDNILVATDFYNKRLIVMDATF
ncbi:conserved protein, unknown function [Babesia microti strain RI]|uniref:methylated diphthine methylhydrolase n=1 Tax=Babesia microti (strain RI) TaxID=1133968 RepID=A0A1R4ABN8_BABMR|nr:conserved protein, unknown function [Babesia microti strain RI]SJK86429.1 conserved protein, unknown function [Babesia microti strain RI]|eukprot:XP_021338587.1 conserved protein, unknown function [Babesia microti strain RI]